MKVFSEDVLTEILDSCETIQQVKEQLDICDKNLDLDVIDAAEGDVIVVSFPVDYGEGARKLLELIQAAKPNNPSFAITKDIDVLIQYPDEALNMLDGIRAKIEKESSPHIVIP